MGICASCQAPDDLPDNAKPGGLSQMSQEDGLDPSVSEEEPNIEPASAEEKPRPRAKKTKPRDTEPLPIDPDPAQAACFEHHCNARPEAPPRTGWIQDAPNNHSEPAPRTGWIQDSPDNHSATPVHWVDVPTVDPGMGYGSISGDIRRLCNQMTIRCSNGKQFSNPAGLVRDKLAAAMTEFLAAELDGAQLQICPEDFNSAGLINLKSVLIERLGENCASLDVLALCTQGPPLMTMANQLMPVQKKYPLNDIQKGGWNIDIYITQPGSAVVTHTRTEQDQLNFRKEFNHRDRIDANKKAGKSDRRDGRRFRLTWSAQFTLQSPILVQFAVNTVQFSDQMNEECRAELLSILNAQYGDSIVVGKTIGSAYE